MVVNVPVCGSKTRFFWMFALKVRRVWRSEWLRVLPKAVFLPVLLQVRDMRAQSIAAGREVVNALSSFHMFAFLTPTFLIGILIALSVHECAHAYVASKLGDDTARLSGRLTLNPLAHLDPLGTILFLVVGFGWGKPVPVAPSAFRHPRRDSALTSLAGPASNLLLAAVCFVLLIAIAPSSMGNGAWDLLAPPVQTSVLHTFLVQLLSGSLFINLGLMAFNLLPVAPLDGSKILEAFIPLRFDEVYATFLRWGPSILLGLLLAERVVGIGLLSGWIGGIMDGVLGVFAMVAGLVIR